MADQPRLAIREASIQGPLQLRASIDTVVANLVHQGSGLLLLLAIPNMLPGVHFSVVVMASVVLSFARFPDLGISLVYGRDVPRLRGAGETLTIQAWDRTMLWFGVLSGAVVGIIAGVAFRATGAAPVDALLLALIPPLTAVSSAYAALSAAHGDFRRYRDIQIMMAAGRLLAIPLVFLFGLTGWFAAQVAGTAVALAGSGLGWVPRPPRIEWRLVKARLPAGIQLAAITLLWFQLLDSARLLAAIGGNVQTIAAYGVVVAAYQAAYGLVISAFLPVSVKILRLLGSDEDAAVAYVQDAIARALPWAFLFAVIAGEGAPWILGLAFPAYAIDPLIPRAMLYGLSAMPILATVGNLLTGRERQGTYLAIMAAALAVAIAAEAALRGHAGAQAPTFAQLSGTLALAGMLLIAGRVLYPGARPSNWWRPAIWLAGFWAAYLMLRSVFAGQGA